MDNILEFKKRLYFNYLLVISKYLKKLEKNPSWTEEEFEMIRRKSSSFLLKNGFLWPWPKVMDGILLRIVGDTNTRKKILQESHDAKVARY
jgi:hypothetical protein